MGQPIVELDRTTVGDVAIFTLDRNLTSMATRAFDEAPADHGTDDFTATLAGRIFASDSDITRIFAASNAVQVTRKSGWDDAAEAYVAAVIADLYRFYV
ncbi:MAG: hypothetical protein WBO25_06600 [Acidimicrobiia bacterium]